jgi:hypothetical protein
MLGYVSQLRQRIGPVGRTRDMIIQVRRVFVAESRLSRAADIQVHI